MAVTRLQPILIIAPVMALIYALTGPWETKDEREYLRLTTIATSVSLEQTTSKAPEEVSRCLLRLPPTTLNLDRLQAGSGVTLANPVQHVLITVASAENGKSAVTVRRPPGKSLKVLTSLRYCAAWLAHNVMNVRNWVVS